MTERMKEEKKVNDRNKASILFICAELQFASGKISNLTLNIVNLNTIPK